MAQLQRFAGGGTGLGGSLASRQFLDEPGQNRFTQPSVLYGLGTGALASVLWYSDIDTPLLQDDFWASHALVSLPTGLFFAAFPKRAGTTTTEQVRQAIFGGGNGGGGGGNTGTERATIRETTGSNGRRR